MARCQQIWEVELASVSFFMKYCSMTNIWDRTINYIIDAIFDQNHSNTIMLTLIAYAGGPKMMQSDTRYCFAASLLVIVGIDPKPLALIKNNFCLSYEIAGNCEKFYALQN